MDNIDYTQVITAETKAAHANARHKQAIKAECSARIHAVLDPHTVTNIQNAAINDILTAEQSAVFRAAQIWVADMLLACRTAADQACEPDWPALPDGLKALASEF